MPIPERRLARLEILAEMYTANAEYLVQHQQYLHQVQMGDTNIYSYRMMIMDDLAKEWDISEQETLNFIG